MVTDYDEIYRETKHALGPPTQVFVDFFRLFKRKSAAILDIGCGQGRDALFIARLGHHVTAVDFAPAGVDDLVKDALSEGLSIDGVVADIRNYELPSTFDVIVIDRTLHMLAEAERITVLKRLIKHVTREGFVLIADEKSNIEGFNAVFDQSDFQWTRVLKRRGYLFVQKAA